MKPNSIFLLLIFAGVSGFFLQLMPDTDLLTFIVILSALTTVVGSRSKMDERGNLLLGRSFSSAFQWSYIGLYIVFTCFVLLGWIPFVQGVKTFLGAHWLGMVAAAMCLLLGGIAGLRGFREAE